jgi:hypothetical protein
MEQLHGHVGGLEAGNLDDAGCRGEWGMGVNSVLSGSHPRV